MEQVHDALRCPACGAGMEEGAVSVSHGLKWRRMRGSDMADMVEDLPGTHAIMRPNHLLAWRCKKCKLVTVQYGKPLEQHPVVQRRFAEAEDLEAAEVQEQAQRREDS